MKYNDIFKTNSAKILDYLVKQDVDIDVETIVKKLNLSRKTVDNVIHRFDKIGIIRKTRKIGKTQMYEIDMMKSITRKLKMIVVEKEK